MRHVPGGINVDQHAHAGYKQQPYSREGIEQETGIGVDLRWLPLLDSFSPSLPTHVNITF